MEALTSLAVALAPAFEPYAPAVFERAMQQLTAQHAALKAQVGGSLSESGVGYHVLDISVRRLRVVRVRGETSSLPHHLTKNFLMQRHINQTCRLMASLSGSRMKWTRTWLRWTFWQVCVHMVVAVAVVVGLTVKTLTLAVNPYLLGCSLIVWLHSQQPCA